MNRTSLCVFALVVVLSGGAGLLAQTHANGNPVQSDSLAVRLGNVKHVGLSIDERLSGYVLHLYTPVQRAENLASLTAYREKSRIFNAQMESLDEQRKAAQQRGASVSELNAITRKRNQLRAAHPHSQFSVRISLYDVVRVGTDYLEIIGAETPGNSVLIPLSRICKIIIVKTPDAGNDADAGEASDEPKSGDSK